MPPAGLASGPPPSPPPGGPTPTAPGGPRTGGGFARGIFLYLAAASVLSGLSALLAGSHVGSAGAAAVLGIGFVVLFVVALALRPGPGLDPVRATLGVLSVLLLVGCFVLAVTAGDQASVDGGTQLVRAAAAAGLFTFGMAGVALLVPSAVAAGLAMPGLVATVVLAAAAAGAEGFGLAVAGLIAAVVALEIAFRAGRLRAHPGAVSWMVNLAGLVAGIAATALGVSFEATAVASAGLVGAALALCAWRWHAVVAAVAAVAPLSLVEGYAVVQATGSDSTAEGIAVLLVGLVLLVVVGAAGLRVVRTSPAVRRRTLVIDELLLLAAAAMALVALSQVGSGFTPFRGLPGSRFDLTPSSPPTFAPFPTPPAFPTLPSG